jgi:two-component system, cell cycle response regulator CpdR
MRIRRVLIVEDEINLAEVLLASLERLGAEYTAEVAYSGPEALARIKQVRFTLLVTDYSMPGMNGLELARRARQVSPDIQIILMTAYTPERLQNTTGDVVLDGVLTKPFSIAEFRRLVEQIC